MFTPFCPLIGWGLQAPASGPLQRSRVRLTSIKPGDERLKWTDVLRRAYQQQGIKHRQVTLMIILQMRCLRCRPLNKGGCGKNFNHVNLYFGDPPVSIFSPGDLPNYFFFCNVHHTPPPTVWLYQCQLLKILLVMNSLAHWNIFSGT